MVDFQNPQPTGSFRLLKNRSFPWVWSLLGSSLRRGDRNQRTWKHGPKEDLFLANRKGAWKNLPIIAEDLGVITPEVEKLRDQFHFPGMKVLQFAFESTEESTFLPHQFTTTNCVCYTGTHDNDTSAGWYQTASEYSRDKVRRYMNTDASSIHFDFIRTCLARLQLMRSFHYKMFSALEKRVVWTVRVWQMEIGHGVTKKRRCRTVSPKRFVLWLVYMGDN